MHRGSSVPTVSICLPVYNGERYLAEAIESVLAQTHRDYELLISDDLSQDTSLEVARTYARYDARVTVWSNPQRLGLFANYNSCMQRATGKYIKLFAQDDLLAPPMLERCLQALSTEANVALVSTARLLIDEKGQPHEATAQLDPPRLQPGQEMINRCLSSIRNWIGEPSAVMFPAALMDSGFDTCFFHSGDLEYWLRIVGHGNYMFLDEPLCSFRQHQGNATKKNMKSLLFALDMLRLGRIYRQRLAELGIDEAQHVRQVIDFSAWYLHKLATEEGITCQDATAVEAVGADKDRLLTEFRELAFYALYHGQESLLEAQAARLESEYARGQAEEKLRRVLGSRTWKAAEALRKLVGAARHESVL